MVSDAVARGTPGELGMPSVSALDPAAMRNASRRAVIAARKLHDLLAAGVAARETGRVHRRLGAARRESYSLDARHHRADQLCELALRLRRRAERGPARRRRSDRLRHGGMRVSEQERAPREHVVDILVSVEIAHDRARAALMKIGEPPTALKARTDEFTPPAMTLRALAKAAMERSLLIACAAPIPSQSR